MKKFAFFVLALIGTILTWVGPACIQYSICTDNPGFLVIGFPLILASSIVTLVGILRIIEDIDDCTS